MIKRLPALLFCVSVLLVGCSSDTSDELAADTDPEKLYQQKCSACHGNDLSGGTGADLSKIGATMSEEEIEEIILKGKSSMPDKLYEGKHAAALAAWLAEKK